jgi:imidazolonepropionase-like amidohydrolase
VKLEAGVTPELYPAVVEASRRAGLPFLGHISIRMDPMEASRLGQRTIEHLMGLPVALSRDRERVRWWTTVLNQPERLSRWERFLARLRPPPSRAEVKRRTVATFDSALADTLFGAFVTNGTAQCPTVVLERERAGLGATSSLGRPEERAVVPWTVRHPGQPRPATEVAADSAYFGLELTLVRRMQRAGVTILAGTDTPAAALVPGFSLHDELELLVAAGLSPLQALAAATTAPARFLGLADSLGTVEEGKTADLLLLDADPLADIRNTRRIRAVLSRGRLLDRPALDRLMADADSLAASWRGMEASGN